MIHKKSVKELSNILSSLKSRIAKYDKDAKRDKKFDYKLLPQSQLQQILRSGIPAEEQRKLLLSQIGLIRINLFSEHLERVRLFEKNNQLDDAVNVMNDYVVSIAIPFVPTKKKPSLINRFMDLISLERLLEPHEYVQKWKTGYQTWFERKPSMHPCISEREQQEKFDQLKITFNMVHAVSFSDNNFPPPPTVVFVDPTRIKI